MTTAAINKQTELYPCPSCGSTDDWRAAYWQPANQGVDLFIGDDGEPIEGEYAGDEDFDGDPSPNDGYYCQACGYWLTLGEFALIDRVAPAPAAWDAGGCDASATN